jgi:hypothetical protein
MGNPQPSSSCMHGGMQFNDFMAVGPDLQEILGLR